MTKRTKLSIDDNNILTYITFDRGYDEFINNGKIRGLAPHTLKFYDNVSKIIYKFLDENYQGYKTMIRNLNLDAIESFISFCKSLGENDITINTNLRALRSILYYFMRVGYLDKYTISLIKAQEPIIETYSEQELKLLLKKPDIKKCTFVDYRNYMVINFLLGTGCRASTLVNIKIGDLDLINDLITYRHTKNKRGQIVPISPALKGVLIDYLKIRRGSQDDYLFPNAYGDSICVNTISESVRNYTRKRGVKTTGLHRFRHTFAKYYILNGGDVFRLKALLGHSTLEITNRYVTLFAPDLKINYESLNPLDRINPNKKRLKMK